jgi:hypothetical protein
MFMIVQLRVGVGWKLDALWVSLTRIPYYPYDGLEW